MQTYIIHFYGRRKGAIGIMSAYKTVREAESADKAIEACYDAFEHISSPLVYVGDHLVQKGWS